MQFNILEVLSYTVVVITILTMIFGLVAYNLYKRREKKRKKSGAGQSTDMEQEKYLYFEEKELL